ncbi:glycosyltransferase [Providencia sp. PROV118]|uniref:glycosyltransferase n=1 Tax=Providencia sp. PROV118 TaxID=2949829 RepID=UPI002349FA98|nr:glycosyltransferase [Providencia sp. PROV118]
MITHISITKKGASQGVSTVVSQFEEDCFTQAGHNTLRPKSIITPTTTYSTKKNSISNKILTKIKRIQLIYLLKMIISARNIVKKNLTILKKSRLIVCHDIFTLLFAFLYLSNKNNISLYNHSDSTPFITLRKNFNTSSCIKIINIIEKYILAQKIYSIYSLSDDSTAFIKNLVHNKDCYFKTVNNFIVSKNNVHYSLNEVPKIFIVGTVCERKRQMSFLEEVRKIKHPLLDSNSFYILGSASSNDIEILNRLDFVYYIGNVSDIKKYLSFGDIILSVSSDEGLPMAMIEGISSGCSIISTDVGGCNRICIDNENGYLIPTSLNKVNTILDLIYSICINKKIRHNFSVKSIETFHANYSEKYALEFWSQELSGTPCIE